MRRKILLMNNLLFCGLLLWNRMRIMKLTCGVLYFSTHGKSWIQGSCFSHGIVKHDWCFVVATRSTNIQKPYIHSSSGTWSRLNTQQVNGKYSHLNHFWNNHSHQVVHRKCINFLKNSPWDLPPSLWHRSTLPFFFLKLVTKVRQGSPL